MSDAATRARLRQLVSTVLPRRATTVPPREPEKFSNEQPHYAA